MDETLNVRLHYAGEFHKTSYVGGKSLLVPVDSERFSYPVLMEFVKDYLEFTEIGGVYISKEKRGGWELVLDDKDVTNFVKGFNNEEEVHFYIDSIVDKDIEPTRQMQPTVIIRPRKNIIQDSPKKPVAKRKYTTTHQLQLQQRMTTRKSPRLSKGTKPVPDLTTSKQDVGVKENGTRRKLNLEIGPDDHADTGENDVENMKRKGTDREACDEYIPENEGEDDSDDSSERTKVVQSSKPGPRTRSRANAPPQIEKEPTSAPTAIEKQPKKAGTTRGATSSSRPSVLKPTCSKLFKQPSNPGEAGSVGAYLAMRERQKQNVAAPIIENVNELDQEGIENEEVEEVQAPRKPRGRSKMSKVHARGPDDKVVVSLNEEGQPISEEKKELSNFLGTLVKDNVSLTYINWHVVPVQLKNEMMEYTLARYVIPEEGHKWVMHTLNEAWRRHKSLMKNAHYKKFATDEQRIENRPNTIPLEDFKMLLKYWGDESVQALAEDNAARRNTISETHTLGPITHAQAKEKLRKDKKLAKPSDAEIYLETYKREPGKTYKADTEKLRTKYMKVQELVNAGKIDEANAVVAGGRTHGRNWLVGRRGKKFVQSEQSITPAAPSDSYVQELTEKIQQNLEAGFMAKVNTIQQNLEAGFMAKVNTKVKENMSWMLTKLGEDNPGLVFDVKELCATASSNYDDSGTPTTQGATNE